MNWIPVISGIVYRPVFTSALPRIGETVQLPVLQKESSIPVDEKTYRVVDVRHYIAYKAVSSSTDVHLEEIK